MAYSTSNPPQLLCAGMGDGIGLWAYMHTDVHTDVDATDYFTNGEELGMKVGDLLFNIESDNGYVATLHAVSAVDSDGNATVSAAVLA